MNSFSRSVTEGVALNAPLDFLARSVQIDNITSSWIWVDGAGRFVPPFQYGVIIPLDGTTQANIRWQTPVGVSVPTAGSASAQCVWLEVALPPSNGQPVTIPSQQILCKIASITSLGGGATATVGGNTITSSIGGLGTADVIFTLPPGANSVILLGGKAVPTTAIGLTRVNVIGVQSQTVYYDTVNNITNFAQWPIAIVISSAADNQLEVQLTFADNTTVTVELAASYGTQAVDISGNANVNLQAIGGSTVASNVAGVLETTPAGATIAAIDIAPAGGANSVIITGVASRAINLISATIGCKELNNTAQAKFQDTNGSTLATAIWLSGAATTGANPPYYFYFGGAALTTGVGLRILNNGGQANTFQGSVSYYFNP